MRRRNFLGALTALPFMPQVIQNSIALDIETWTPGTTITWPPGLSPLQVGTHIHTQIELQLKEIYVEEKT